MRHAKTYRRGALVKSILFFAALLVLTVVSLIPSLHPEESILEGRKLTEFPDFSVRALLTGEYFDGIDTWFSDTLPGREMFLDISHKVSSLYGIRTVEIHGETQKGDAIPDTPFTG